MLMIKKQTNNTIMLIFFTGSSFHAPILRQMQYSNKEEPKVAYYYNGAFYIDLEPISANFFLTETQTNNIGFALSEKYRELDEQYRSQFS